MADLYFWRSAAQRGSVPGDLKIVSPGRPKPENALLLDSRGRQTESRFTADFSASLLNHDANVVVVSFTTL